MKIVGNGGRERRPEYRDRRGINDLRSIAVADRADRFEQGPRAIEVDVITLVEIELGLTGNDTGEMEDDVRAAGFRDLLAALLKHIADALCRRSDTAESAA